MFGTLTMDVLVVIQQRYRCQEWTIFNWPGDQQFSM